jgi:hypothetical protein
MSRIFNTLALKLVVLVGATASQAFPQSTNSSSNPYPPDAPGASQAATDLRVFGSSPEGWLFPITNCASVPKHLGHSGGVCPAWQLERWLD